RTASLGHLARTLEPPLRRAVDRSLEPGERRRREPAEVESQCAVLRNERTVALDRLLGEVCREGNAQTLRIADVQSSRRFRPAEPLLAGHGVEVQLADLDGNSADRLRAVHEERKA